MDLMPMIILGVTGLAAAVILFIVAKRFAVNEDPRIAEVEVLLPGANCGACGRKGCHDFAVACCSATSLNGLRCPGAGDASMKAIASLLGFEAAEGKRERAFIKCNGTKCNRLVSRNAVAVSSCRLAQTLAYPENFCAWGCLGCGDCVAACGFGALTMDGTTGMPRIDIDKCTGCGACVKACPQHIIMLREIDASTAAVWVSCSNHAKGAQARKMCQTACIACGKCVRTCPSKAITIKDNVAVIDAELCTGCQACVEGCPTKAIHSLLTVKEVKDV